LEYYLEILNQEGMKAADTLLIGNDPKNDLPATRAGVSVFLIRKSKNNKPLILEGQKAPAWVGNFDQLKRLLIRTPASLLSSRASIEGL
jgi:FMN phosphatase YigB (HAD superfamily)